MDRSNIKMLKPDRPVNDDLVSILEAALSEARDGGAVSGGVYLTMHDGGVATNFSRTENAIMEVASVMRLLHRLNLNLDK